MKKNIRNILLLIVNVLIVSLQSNYAQNTFPSTGAAGIGTTAPNASSLLEIKSTSKGFLVPRMTKNQRDAIASPAIGLLIYQTNNTPGFYYYDGSAWKAVAGAAYTAGTGISITGNAITNTAPDKVVTIAPATGMTVTGNYPNYALSFVSSPWFTGGNTGTNPSVNFIGTTDAQPLVFKANNVRAAYLDYTGNNNSSFGYEGLLANTTGFYNAAFGYNALKANKKGGRNTALGAYTLTVNTADNNTAIGTYALSANTNGTGNVAAGVNALAQNTGGDFNVALGANSLYSNITGNENTGIGYGALFTNQTGVDNAAFGKYALYNNNGDYNTGLGFNAMFFNTTGTHNTATGSIALQNNTTSSNNTANGYASLYSNNGGNENTAMGVSALYANISGSDNTATGYGALNSNTASNNTANGAYALYLNTSGANNTATGYEALYQNTTGSYNTANGLGALTFNSTGSNNTASGYKALYTNTTGELNTATGVTALYYNTTGSGNTATGLEALHFNTTGYNNTATGLDALLSNTTGGNNTAAGYQSLLNNVSGDHNTAIGYNAMFGNKTGGFNTALGTSALSNSTGSKNTSIGAESLSGISVGSENTALGYWAIHNNQGSQNTAVGNETIAVFGGGSANTACGYRALHLSGSSNNAAFGHSALLINATGANNTAIGTNALFSVVSGSDNIALGYGADAESAVNNSIIIGKNVRATASNIASIGNGSTTFLYGPIYITNSDGRFKKNIKENVPGLEFIKALRPVSYAYTPYEMDKFLLQNDTTKLKELKQTDYTDAQSKIHLGFIAQELEKVMNDKGYTGEIVNKPKTSHDKYGIAYTELIAPIVKAMQELSAQNDSLKATNTMLQAQLQKEQTQIDEVKKLVLAIEQRQQQCMPCNTINNMVTKSVVGLTDEISLQQNIPNPFANGTTIGYSLPLKFTTAQIIITDKNGKTLKTINISGNGKGSLQIDASTLSSGAYQYSLVVDHKIISSKQMIISK